MNKLLTKSSALPIEFVRISSELIDSSILRMSRRKEDNDTIVHSLRKNVKNLRAFLKLLREDTGESFFKRFNYNMRNMNRGSADLRTPAAVIELIKRYNALKSVAGFQELQLRLEADFLEIKKNSNYENIFGIYQTGLKKYKLGLTALKIRGKRFSGIRNGLGKTYLSAKRSLALSKQNPSEDILHELRKNVKELYYCCNSIIPLKKSYMSNYASELKRLSETLGDIHDFWDLNRYIGTFPPGSYDFTRVNLFISDIQKMLLSTSMETSERVFTENADQFTARIESYYKIYKKKY